MSEKKFAEECLKTHNEFRKKHGVSSLKLNKAMSAMSQKWADHLAKTNTFAHSPDRDYKGDKMGENIAMKWTSSGDDFTGEQCTDQWYSEITKYNFQGNGGGSGTGHFTQVVWKDSKELGVARAQTRDGKWLVVANYLPAGNFLGRYKENVSPPKDGKIVVPEREAKGGKGDKGSSVARVTHTPEHVRTVTYDGGNSTASSSSSQTRTVTREVRGGQGGGATSYSKTVVTETIVGPDGQKRTVTRETVTSDDGASAEMPSRFRNFGLKDDGFNSKPSGFKTTSSWEPVEAKKETKEKEKKPQKIKDFIDDVIKAHNKYRKTHGKVGDMKHNKEQSVLAQRWADHLAATSKLGHSNDSYKGKPLGENVATKWSSAGADYTGQEVTEQWYSEISKYDWRRAEFTSGTGHFTQVVWKGSKEIGVGKSFGSDGRVFVVCNYAPAGNVVGQFADNVFPAK